MHIYAYIYIFKYSDIYPHCDSQQHHIVRTVVHTYICMSTSICMHHMYIYVYVYMYASQMHVCMSTCRMYHIYMYVSAYVI